MRIAAIGEREQVQAYALAGVLTGAADNASATRAAWRALPPDVGLVILTPAAHTVLAADGLDEHDERLFVVLPT
jgi:vacuolar-type H+-ATPase subunit F/Vma7